MPKSKRQSPKKSTQLEERKLENENAEPLEIQPSGVEEDQAAETHEYQHLSDRRLASGLAAAASLDLDRLDVARLTGVMSSDPDWIAFTSTDAKWINLTPEMKMVFASWEMKSHDGAMALGQAWVDDVIRVLSSYISQQIIETASRAALFRSLGRGWIWIQLSSAGSRFDTKRDLVQANRTRFKWWFEDLDRVLRNRKQELTQLNFIGDNVEGDVLQKYTTGYMPLSEFVFLLRGIYPGKPNIGIQKWCADFRHLDKWAATDDVRAAIGKQIATDEERHQHAMNVQRQKERRNRQKQKQKLKKLQEKEEKERDLKLQELEVDDVLSAHEKMHNSNAEFEDLLASLKAGAYGGE